jgi:hypothetical protein
MIGGAPLDQFARKAWRGGARDPDHMMSGGGEAFGRRTADAFRRSGDEDRARHVGHAG